MDKQRLDDQQEPICNSSVLIQDVALKTYQEWWMIVKGGRRGSGRSVLAARHDDDEILQKQTTNCEMAGEKAKDGCNPEPFG